MNAIDLLLQRTSEGRLVEPAPGDDALQWMLRAALRAPDHARLKPWRCLRIAGAQRERLGELFVQALRQRKPQADGDEIEKVRRQPLRAPLLLVMIARVQDHPKVPPQEQVLATGCAAHAILLAADALGFAGIWRTGDNAYDRHVAEGLGLADNEQIVGFLYLGTAAAAERAIPALDPQVFCCDWR